MARQARHGFADGTDLTRVGEVHAVSDIDHALDDFTGDAEAEVGLVARSHHADEFADGVSLLEGDALNLDRALALRGWCGVGVTAREQEQRGEGENAMEAGVGERHWSHFLDREDVMTDEIVLSSQFGQTKTLGCAAGNIVSSSG